MWNIKILKCWLLINSLKNTLQMKQNMPVKPDLAYDRYLVILETNDKGQ